jgi:hypothetical protein
MDDSPPHIVDAPPSHILDVSVQRILDASSPARHMYGPLPLARIVDFFVQDQRRTAQRVNGRLSKIAARTSGE